MKNLKRHIATAILCIFSLYITLSNFNITVNAKENIIKVPIAESKDKLSVVTKNKYMQKNEEAVNETKKLKFGTNIGLSASYASSNGSSNVVKPGEKVNINLLFKDEYGNNIENFNNGQQSSFNYSVLVNGVERKRGSTNDYGYITVDPEVIAESFDIKFDTIRNTKKYESNSLNYKMNINDYKQISVKDPEGNAIVKGKFGNNYQLSNANITNGIAYIEKSILENKMNNVSVSGINSNGISVVYTNLSLDTNTTEIKDSTASKVPIKANLPENCSGDISVMLYDVSNSNGQSVYNETYNLQDFNVRYKNNFLWISKGKCIFSVNFNSYNNNVNESYILADNSDGSKTINLDYNNTTKINANIGGRYELGLSIEDVFINSQYPSTNSTYKVSSNIFDGYNVYDYSSSKPISYKKHLSSKIIGEIYNIYVSQEYRIKAEVLGESKLIPSQDATAELYILDKYDNIVNASMQSTSKEITIQLNAEGKNLNTIKKTNYDSSQPYKISFNPSVVVPSFDATFSLDFLGKTYTSNSVTYTVDGANYSVISVKDPNGKPLYKGEVRQYGKSYTISNGNLYIPKDQSISGTLAITGNNQEGDYIICPKVSVPKGATEILLQGKKVALSTNFAQIDGVNNGNLNISFIINSGTNGKSINYNSDKSIVTNINIWLQDNSDCYVDNRFYDKNNNTYVLGRKFNNSSSSVKIDANDITEIKLGGNHDKNPSVIISQNKYIGGSGYQLAYSRLFVSSNTYYFDFLSSSNDGPIIEYTPKYNEIINGVTYTIFQGKDYKGDYTIPRLLKGGDSINVTGNTVDEYENSVSFFSGSTKELQIIDLNGNTVKTLKYENGGFTVPSDLAEGTYSVTINNYVNNIKTSSNTIDNVYITSGSLSDLGYYGNESKYDLYDSATAIYSETRSNNPSSITIPNTKLEEGKNYLLDILEKSDNGLIHYNKSYVFRNGKLEATSSKNTISVNLEANVKKLIVTTSSGKSMQYDGNDSSYNNTLCVGLVEGESYTISAYTQDIQGGFWATTSVKADSSLNSIKFDRNSSRQISLTNKFASNIEIVELTAKRKSTGEVFYINRGLKSNGSIYLPIGQYDIKFKLNLNGTSTLNEYNKDIDLTLGNYNLIVGGALSCNILLDKSTYSANDKIMASISDLKDEDTALEGIGNTSIDSSTITMSLLHGVKPIKSFGNTIPDSIKGECRVIINANIAGVGNVSSKPINIIINNSKAIKEGDINLDGVVDIFDIIYVAKDFGKTKNESDFDPRINLDSSDSIIDAKDLARAAVNYEQ